MNRKIKIAFLCYLLVILSGITIGLVYLFSPEIMPYHQRAIGVMWRDLEPGLQLVLLTLLKGTGLGILMTSLALGLLLVIPFRRGETWSRWAISVLGLGMLLPGFYFALRLYLITGALTPWPFMILLVALILAGFFLSGDIGRARRR
jgi:hypothetical protein